MKSRLLLFLGITCLCIFISNALIAQQAGKKSESTNLRNHLPVVLVLNLEFSILNRSELLDAAKKALIPYSKKPIRLITSPFERPQAEAFFKQHLGLKSSDEITANIDTLQHFLSRYNPRMRLSSNWSSFLLLPSHTKYQLKELEVPDSR